MLGDKPILRRILNCLGGQYADIADFPASMHCLQSAIQLATEMKDLTAEAACLANVVTVMQEMGHYQRAIEMARIVILGPDLSDSIRGLKLQCSSSGLFAAHRIGDAAAAAEFLVEGERHLSYALSPIARFFFEKNRALYLIDNGSSELAASLVEISISNLREVENPRLKILATISVALCEWAQGQKGLARERLSSLYAETKVSNLYHSSVLQALVKTFSDSETSVQSQEGLTYAHELVEFTTRVKKAKFYRQLAKRGERIYEAADASRLSYDPIDPFGQVKDWMARSDIGGSDQNGPSGERPELATHEELAAIHGDMAKLRSATLRRDIRTDAVDTAENWAIAAEFFDDETGQHCFRVGHLAGMLAREIGMDETFCVQIEHAARLHDIGKIAINEVILLKPGPLDASEMAAMRLHTEVGAQMLAGSDDPTLKMAAEVARHHHEWWNGGGYPLKLRSRAIPLSARISAFADVYDALTHARAYKAAWSHDRALEEIVRLRGVQFDPDLIAPFENVLKRYQTDIADRKSPGLVDMDSNPLISTRRRLMETIAAGTH